MAYSSGSQRGANRPLVGKNDVLGGGRRFKTKLTSVSVSLCSPIVIGKRKEMEIDANFVLNAFSLISRPKIILA